MMGAYHIAAAVLFFVVIIREGKSAEFTPVFCRHSVSLGILTFSLTFAGSIVQMTLDKVVDTVQ